MGDAGDATSGVTGRATSFVNCCRYSVAVRDEHFASILSNPLSAHPCALKNTRVVPVPAGLYHPQLLLRPRVQRRRSDETPVDPQLAVQSAAVQAKEDTVAHRRPGRVLSPTVKTQHVFGFGAHFPEQHVPVQQFPDRHRCSKNERRALQPPILQPSEVASPLEKMTSCLVARSVLTRTETCGYLGCTSPA